MTVVVIRLPCLMEDEGRIFLEGTFHSWEQVEIFSHNGYFNLSDYRCFCLLYNNKTIGNEAGTISIFYPDADPLESTTTDGEVWQNPDGETYFVSGTGDNIRHTDAHSLSTVLRIGQLGGIIYESWFRFNNVVIPQGSTITSANMWTIPIAASSHSSANALTNIYAEDSDDAPIISDDTGWHNQTLTTAFSAYDIVAGDWVESVREQMSSITSVVQEVVDRGGWTSGSDMAFFWLDDSSPNGSSVKPSTYSSADIAQLFVVEWTPTTPGTAWSTIRDGIGNNYNDWSATATIQVLAATTTDKWQNTGRMIFTFDTSAIADTDAVTEATLGITAISKTDSYLDSISLVTSAPADNTILVKGDFDSLGTTKQATDILLLLQQ